MCKREPCKSVWEAKGLFFAFVAIAVNLIPGKQEPRK